MVILPSQDAKETSSRPAAHSRAPTGICSSDLRATGGSQTAHVEDDPSRFPWCWNDLIWSDHTWSSSPSSSSSAQVCVTVMLFMDCKMLDVLRGRRRLRVWVCKPPCSFWFLLLFAVGGLVLFIHLQDLSDMVLQQSPGEKNCIIVNHAESVYMYLAWAVFSLFEVVMLIWHCVLRLLLALWSVALKKVHVCIETYVDPKCTLWKNAVKSIFIRIIFQLLVSIVSCYFCIWLLVAAIEH